MSLSTYQFKTSPYSSHNLLLGMLPERGEGRLVLDVGCGDGYLCESLGKRGYEVTGIDKEILPRNTSFRPLVFNLDERFPKLDENYDYILCADVLEHLCYPWAVLETLKGLLIPNGTILASLPNSGNLYFRAQVAAGRFPQHDRGLFDRTHLHFYTWDGWRRLFEDAGLHIEEVRVSGIPFELMFVAHAGLALKMERLSWLAARAWKKLFAYQFIVRARLA